MSGRFVWLDEDDLEFTGREDDIDELWAIYRALTVKRDAAPVDPMLAFIEATRLRRAFGDAEWQVETIAVGLRALGMPRG